MPFCTEEDVANWVKSEQARKSSHVLILYDKFDGEYLPVYIAPGEDVEAAIKKYNRGLQIVKEVYNMSMDIEAQLKGGFTWNI